MIYVLTLSDDNQNEGVDPLLSVNDSRFFIIRKNRLLISEDFKKTYICYKPGSSIAQRAGIKLNKIYIGDTNLQALYQQNNTYESHEFANWDEFWEWFMVKYGIEML